jgi:hypothetical protein
MSSSLGVNGLESVMLTILNMVSWSEQTVS